MATWPPESWVDDERVTVAVLTTRVTDAFTALNAHTHDGSGGDGSANITPSSVLFTDQADLDAPASGKTVLWSNSGKLHQRTNGGAAQEMDVVGHGHTWSEVATNVIHDDETVSGSVDPGAAGENGSASYVQLARVTYTPSTATAACVVHAHTSFWKALNTSPSATAVDSRILIGGAQVAIKSTTMTGPLDNTKANAHHLDMSLEYVDIDRAASSTNYDLEAKQVSGGSLAGQMRHAGIGVTEINV
jgi:hypothetical protein